MYLYEHNSRIMKVKVITKPLWIHKNTKKGVRCIQEFFYANRIEDGERTAYSIMSNRKGK